MTLERSKVIWRTYAWGQLVARYRINFLIFYGSSSESQVRSLSWDTWSWGFSKSTSSACPWSKYSCTTSSTWGNNPLDRVDRSNDRNRWTAWDRDSPSLVSSKRLGRGTTNLLSEVRVWCKLKCTMADFSLIVRLQLGTIFSSTSQNWRSKSSLVVTDVR